MNAFTEYTSRDHLFSGLASVVSEQLEIALNLQGRATIAVPGGTTPAPFFEQLRQCDLDWANVSVMLTDERFVPETSDRSNTRLLFETFLRDRAAAATYVPLYQPAERPESILEDLRLRIEAALPLDICVLGMGTDMHTASLFPGADLLAHALSPSAPVLLPMRAPGAPEPRMTLTSPVLRGASAVHLLITGPEKRAALEIAQQDGPIEQAPVRCVLDQAHVHYAD